MTSHDLCKTHDSKTCASQIGSFSQRRKCPKIIRNHCLDENISYILSIVSSSQLCVLTLDPKLQSGHLRTLRTLILHIRGWPIPERFIITTGNSFARFWYFHLPGYTSPSPCEPRKKKLLLSIESCFLIGIRLKVNLLTLLYS